MDASFRIGVQKKRTKFTVVPYVSRNLQMKIPEFAMHFFSYTVELETNYFFMQFCKPRDEEPSESLHSTISQNCAQYKKAHRKHFFLKIRILSLILTGIQLQYSTVSLSLSHLFTYTYILKDEQNRLLKCFWDKMHSSVKGVFVLGQRKEGEIQRENEGWQRRGVTETITVIPCVAAWRYALHHSSFICSLASLFCISLSVCSVTSLRLSYLLFLSLLRLLTYNLLSTLL